MIKYRTVEGDRLDIIAYKHYGKQDVAFEAVLQANPHIVDVSAVLPIGVVVNLPELRPEEEQQKTFINLWD